MCIHKLIKMNLSPIFNSEKVTGRKYCQMHQKKLELHFRQRFFALG